MSFIAISINAYIKKHLLNNPTENEMDLRKRLNSALKDYLNDIKCSCGNDIWIVGSASVGNSCFTCITGESEPNGFYEIESAKLSRENKKGQNHIDTLDRSQINGYFDDDGFQVNSELIKKPSMCIVCLNDSNPSEEIFCNMTRYDQKDTEEFKCFSFRNISA